jgi:hypothetical protein
MSAGFLGRAGLLLGRVFVSFGLGAHRPGGAGHAQPERDADITVTLGTVTTISISLSGRR